MKGANASPHACNRRNLLKTLAWGSTMLGMRRGFAQESRGTPQTANGGTEPYPIPWLDKNGSHNQPAGPNLEPSHIYHFQGRVARCSTFTGMGTDNRGNRIAFGSPTTDYGVMQGEYWAGRTTQHGRLYAHMTDPFSGAGGPREPNSRFPSANCSFRTLLGGCRAGGGPANEL